MSSVQSAQSKLSAMCTCVEEYVEKMLFLDQYMAGEKALDAACNQVGWYRTHIKSRAYITSALFNTSRSGYS
jgi:hypothetical protein